MPSDSSTNNRKDFLKDKKPSTSEPEEIVTTRGGDSLTTLSSHYNNHDNTFSCRLGGGPGPSDFLRPLPGHGKPVGEGWHSTSVEAGPRVSVVSSIHTSQKEENSKDLLHPNDQRAKNNDDGVSTTVGQKLEKEASLGSSLDWNPLKWTRSGNLLSRGSSLSHLSSCKAGGVDSVDTKMDDEQGTIILSQPTSGDAATFTCVTPNAPDEARKKARLGWGEGLAKYEKKKVNPDDILDKETEPRNATVDSVSSSESLRGKSPSLIGNTESLSSTTSCSFACSLSPGVDQKTAIMAATVDNDTCNASVALSKTRAQGLTFSLENVDVTEGFNFRRLLDELLQTDDAGFAMDKFQVWKADISRTLEVTEAEIDTLEHELKLKSQKRNTEVSRNTYSVDKADVILEETVSFVDMDTRSEKAECSRDRVYHDTEDKLYDSVLGSNKVTANETCDELCKLLPTTQLHTGVLRSTDDSDIKERFDKRKRFLKFKERVTTLKFRILQYSWKENLGLLSVESGAKSQKKFESSSRMGYADQQRHRASSHSRLTSLGGSLRLVPCKEVVEYACMLLSDSQVKTYRKVTKMPIFILDKHERTSSMFISYNGLVENPIDVEKERSIMNSWSVEDIETFLDKFALFGKNFRKIASFIPHKTVADCVEFYYKSHKSETFQKIKKKSQFSKGKSCNASTTYLVTSGRRLNRETGSTSLHMLGAASAMNGKQRLNGVAIYFNEQENAAAHVLAGICGSVSSEAVGSCITSSTDHQKVGCSSNGQSLNNVNETRSDDSGGEEINSSVWTDEERSSFVKALRSHGKDFSMVSRCIGSRSSDECKVFFSKARKCLRLDVIDLEAGSEGTPSPDRTDGGGDQDDHDAFMVDSGSGISHDKSSMECKMDLEDSDSRKEEHADSGRNLTEIGSRESVSNGNLEGAADMAESTQNTCSVSSAGLTAVCVNTSDLNAALENYTHQETTGNRKVFLLFPENPKRKTCASDDSIRRSSSTDGDQTRNVPQTELKVDETLLLPRDCGSQTGTDIEKPSGDLKLFGKIITNHSLPKASTSLAQESEKSANNDLQLQTTCRFCGVDRMQTGFSNISTLPKLDRNQASGNEQYNNLYAVSGFQTTKLPTINGGPYCHVYSQPITVDKLCRNGVSDPMAAIRMHYVKDRCELKKRC